VLGARDYIAGARPVFGATAACALMLVACSLFVLEPGDLGASRDVGTPAPVRIDSPPTPVTHSSARHGAAATPSRAALTPGLPVTHPGVQGVPAPHGFGAPAADTPSAGPETSGATAAPAAGTRPNDTPAPPVTPPTTPTLPEVSVPPVSVPPVSVPPVSVPQLPVSVPVSVPDLPTTTEKLGLP
jgi:hypothetical protein